MDDRAAAIILAKNVKSRPDEHTGPMRTLAVAVLEMAGENASLRLSLEKLVAHIRLFHGGGETWASFLDAEATLKEQP